MPDAVIAVDDREGVAKSLDTRTVGADLHRQLAVVGDPAVAAAVAAVQATAPVGTEYGLVVRAVPGGTQAVAGTVDVGNFPATFATQPARAAASAHTSVAASVTSVPLLAANPDRLGATVYNDSAAVLYLKLGPAASATSYTLQVAPGGYYEVPAFYTGELDGLWASAAGSARVGEFG